MNIAIIDKAPSRNNYSKYFDFPYEQFHMSSVPITKLLKRDVDLDIDCDLYDFVILVGSEAAKEYAKISSVTTMAGVLVDNKFIAISNPSMLVFKPEGKPAFEASVAKINKYVAGTLQPPSAVGDFQGISDTRVAIRFLQEVLESNAAYVAMDTETTCLYPRDGYVLGLSISYKPMHGRYILTDCLDEECERLLRAILAKYRIVFHNMKFDIKMIEYHLGLIFDRTRVDDTMLLHYSLDENAEHGLKSLAIKHTSYGDYDRELEEFKAQYCRDHGIKVGDFTYDLIPFDIMCKYASIDTAAAWELFAKFYPIVMANAKLKWVYENLLVQGTLFLMDMEEVGIPISVERMQAAEVFLNEEIEKSKTEIFKFEAVQNYEKDSNSIFNPGSVNQLRKVLFDYAGLESTGKKTATGAISTDAEVLEELSKEHALPAAILATRKLTKIRNTYISKILPELDADSRIRTNFNLIFTTSGRLSSSGKFNAQQIPRDDPLVKACIKAPEGYSIVSQDLKTGEVYYAAVLSKDTALQNVFKSGGDFHSNIAHSVFALPCTVEAVKELFAGKRQAAKAITFGIMYGSGPAKVSETVTKETKEYYSIDDAKEDILSYFTKFRRLKDWLNERKKFIEANGFTYSFFGRKRRLPNVFSADKGIAAHEVRSGINAEVQSICSDVNLLAAIETANELKVKKLDAKIFMLVHDSIVALVRDDLIPEYKEIVKRNTQKDRGCSIMGCPIGVDHEVGKDYSFGKWEKKYILENGVLQRCP